MSRSIFCAVILSVFCCVSVQAGTVDRSTVTFGFGTGYSAVLNQTSSTVTVGTLLDGPGYLDTFYNVVPSGGSNTYAYTIQVTNLTASAVGHYHFRLGVTDHNYYNAIDSDGDSVPDAVDPDQDGDTLANAVDNAPFLSNISQMDDDGDSWGNAIDLRPSNASIPLNLVGGPKTAPFIVAPGFLSITNSAVGLGYTGTLSSDTFANWMFVGSDIVFDTGSLAPNATAMFTLNIVVPDGLENDGFVLRQYADAAAPEPASMSSIALAVSLGALRRRR